MTRSAQPNQTTSHRNIPTLQSFSPDEKGSCCKTYYCTNQLQTKQENNIKQLFMSSAPIPRPFRDACACKWDVASVRAPRLRVGRPIRNGVSSASKVEKKLYSGLFSAVVGTLSGVSRVVAIHPLIHSIPQPWVHQSFGPVLALWRDEFLHPRPQPI